MNEQSDSKNELSKVMEKICEIANETADGDYISVVRLNFMRHHPTMGEFLQTFVVNIWMILSKRILKLNLSRKRSLMRQKSTPIKKILKS